MLITRLSWGEYALQMPRYIDKEVVSNIRFPNGRDRHILNGDMENTAAAIQ